MVALIGVTDHLPGPGPDQSQPRVPRLHHRALAGAHPEGALPVLCDLLDVRPRGSRHRRHRPAHLPHGPRQHPSPLRAPQAGPPRHADAGNALLATAFLSLLFILFGWWNDAHGGSAFVVRSPPAPPCPSWLCSEPCSPTSVGGPQLGAMAGPSIWGAGRGGRDLALGWVVIARAADGAPGLLWRRCRPG